MPERSQIVQAGDRPRVAVMGAGRWGSNLVRVLASLPEVDLAWIVDPDPRARRRAARLCSRAQVTAELGPALREVSAFVVCTPVADHFEHARLLLEAGKHVLLEKPMTTDATAAARLIRLASKSGRTLMLGHQLLYHPLFVRLEELLDSGAIGEPREVFAERTGPIDLDREPDAIWAFGPHDVAMILALARAPLAVSTVHGLLHAERRVPIAVDIRLATEAGIDAQIRLRRDARRKLRRLTVLGDDGTMVFDDSRDGGLLQLRDGAVEYGDRAIVGGPGEPLLAECRCFVDSLLGRGAPRTGGAHGLAVTEVLERAGQQLVEVDYLPSPSSSLMNSSKKTRCLRKRTVSKALT